MLDRAQFPIKQKSASEKAPFSAAAQFPRDALLPHASHTQAHKPLPILFGPLNLPSAKVSLEPLFFKAFNQGLVLLIPFTRLPAYRKKALPIVKGWQGRPLEGIYAVVFMDAVHYHVRHEGRIVKRAVYTALGIGMNGRKDVLGRYVGQNGSAKFWLSILNGLKNRGAQSILIACADGLSGFPQAIKRYFRKQKFSSVPFIGPELPPGLYLTRKSSL